MIQLIKLFGQNAINEFKGKKTLQVIYIHLFNTKTTSSHLLLTKISTNKLRTIVPHCYKYFFQASSSLSTSFFFLTCLFEQLYKYSLFAKSFQVLNDLTKECVKEKFIRLSSKQTNVIYFSSLVFTIKPCYGIEKEALKKICAIFIHSWSTK